MLDKSQSIAATYGRIKEYQEVIICPAIESPEKMVSFMTKRYEYMG